MENQANADEPLDRLRIGTDPTFDSGRDRNLVPPLAILLGGVILFGAIGGWLATRSEEPPAVAMVSPADIPDAIATLNPGAAQQARSDSRECRFPLGFLTIATPGNAAGGTVRFHTTKYQSPTFMVSDKPQRVAIPNPLPETGGIDPLVVEGEAKGLVVALYPPARMEPVNNTATVRVIWRPRPPCKS
jgi:hypothetical protein